MRFTIKRTGFGRPAYLNNNGWFNVYDIKSARVFETKEDAEWRLELEKSDPVYDKPYMEDVTFEIVEMTA